MHTSFSRKTLPGLIAALALISLAAFGSQALAQSASVLPAKEPYSLSYTAGGYDDRGNFLGGTELMNLVGFEGKLYAGVGYWMDRPQLFPSPVSTSGGSGSDLSHSNPEHVDPPSGPQILVLDSNHGQWRQEHNFSQRNDTGKFKYSRLSAMQVIRFHRFDAAGNILGTSVEMLMISLDGENGGVYTQRSPGNWEDTRLPAATPIRSFAVHYDPSDRTEKLFAGTGGGQDRDLDRAIYAGVYDASAPGMIRWNPTPERFSLESRVMSMVEHDGSLYAAAKPSILRRNDTKKSWEVIYSYPIAGQYDQSKYTSGFRGLTFIIGPEGKKALLSGFEGQSGDILRIDPQTGAAVVELNTRQFLTQQWGSPLPAARRDIIAGYNDIPAVKSGGNEIRLFGLLAGAPSPNEINAAWFLSRTPGDTPRYELHKITPPLTWPYTRSDAKLWSVRAIAVSPFPEDQGQILYMGGYDGHFKPDHNTAWLDRVGVDTALRPYKNERQ